MKILHVVNISFVLPYYIGEQFDYFREKGVEIFVACSYSTHLINYGKEKNFVPIPINILRKINPLEDLKAILYLRKRIREESIDIVVGHTPKGALIAMVAAYLAGVNKRVYFRHGLVYETAKGFKRKLLLNIEKLTGFLATKVVCVSGSVLEISKVDRLSSISKNIILNRGTCNGLDAVKKFNKSLVPVIEIDALKLTYKLKDEKVVGYVGRLVNDKGIKELILAWKKIVSVHDNVKLLLVGPFEERDAISEDIQNFILNEPSIIYTGLIENIAPFYRLMDMFVLPSYREGFPTVVLEASAMELPVITTNVTGCRDSILENETGIFTNIDPESIFKSIHLYLQDPELAKRHGVNGRLFILKNFGQENIWKELSDRVFEFNF